MIFNEFGEPVSPGLASHLTAAETAIEGASVSIAGLTARMDAVEITGGTAAERIGILEQTAAEAAPGLRNIVDNHSVELGFDNAPVLTESEDEDGNPETLRPFRSFVVGDNNSYGDSCVIYGSNNENTLGWVTVIGSRNKTYQFQTIIGDLNEFESAVHVTVFGMSNKGSDKARSAFIVGNSNVVNGESSFTIGNRIANSAKLSLVFGKNLIVSDDVENEGGFFLGTGELTGSTVSDGSASFIHRVYKAVDNPLYVEGGTESRYIAKRAPSTWYRGRLRPVECVIPVSGTTSVVPLDHDRYSRWRITGTSQYAFTLENWEDGDVGEVVVDTATQNVVTPMTWVFDDTWGSRGVHVLEIRQEGGTVFARVVI